MIRILIADDETVTRRGLTAMLQRDLREEIEWLEAGNGEEALKLVRRYPVDLIITDICMPLCNGLAFVEKLRESQQNITVIIISGYANFEYAKQAVRLGVKDYIMKPVDKEEFLRLVEGCLAEIHRKQRAAEQESLQQAWLDQRNEELCQASLRRLLAGNADDFNRKTLEEAGLDFSASSYCCASLEYDFVSKPAQNMDLAVRQQVAVYLSDRKLNALSAIVHPGRIGILLWGKVEETITHPVLRDLIWRVERLCRVHAVCGVSGTVYSQAKIPSAFLRSVQAADRKLCGISQSLMPFEEGETQVEPLFAHSLLEHWEPGCGKQIIWAFQSGMAEPLSQSGINRLRLSYEQLRTAALSSFPGSLQADREPFRAFSDLWSIFELRSEVEAMVQQMDSSIEDSGGSQLAREIIHYTIDHATEDIDLNCLASRFGKTPGYIGKLFRQGSSMGFNEFVTTERIKLAKQLLRSPERTIQEIGEACGYHDAKYFSTAFRKITGISPKVFRERRYPR